MGGADDPTGLELGTAWPVPGLARKESVAERNLPPRADTSDRLLAGEISGALGSPAFVRRSAFGPRRSGRELEADSPSSQENPRTSAPFFFGRSP